MQPSPQDIDVEIERVITQGRVGRALTVTFAIPDVAWRHSRARLLCQTVRRAIRERSEAERVRLCGTMLLSATLTHTALYLALYHMPPRRVVALWSAAFATGLLMTLGGSHIAHAMRDRRRREGRHPLRES